MTEKAPDAFRTISEAAEELDIPQHVLRFWETRFPQIKPLKRGGGRRYYRPEDVDLLRGIRYLLYAEGYTIKGVLRILKEHGYRAVADSWKVEAEWKPEAQAAAAAPEAAVEAAPPEALIEAPAVPDDFPAPGAAAPVPVESQSALADPAAFAAPEPVQELPAMQAAAPPAGPLGNVSIIRGGLKRQLRGAKPAPQPRLPLMPHEGASRSRSRRAPVFEPLPLTGDTRGALQAALAELTAMRKILDSVRKR